MPHRPSVGDQQDHDDDDFSARQRKRSSLSPSARNMLGRTWNKVEHWLKKDSEAKDATHESQEKTTEDGQNQVQNGSPEKLAPLPSLPRHPTLQRLNSEKRDRLYPHEPDSVERRTLSVDRRGGAAHGRSLSPSSPIQPFHSAPDIYNFGKEDDELGQEPFPEFQGQQNDDPNRFSANLDQYPTHDTIDLAAEEQERLQLQSELEKKWILNLSMYFKDRSDREKFFLTYAEEPNRWRRVTISCDYRNASPDSLEADLKSMQYQRDKSARIYEAIRDSLPSIQFYPTVTNLKLKTKDGRLHIHCTEDLNEIIKYPTTALLETVQCPRYRDSEVTFQSHMSGFVYKVSVQGKTFVKKEIPGPEAVEEFLYEAHALSALKGSKNVIEFQGLVVDDDDTQVKGLLISLAPQGALVDIIYDSRYDFGVSWAQRERWARQIINGLMEIHEAGFVQGDFTLSNLVVDADDIIHLIDINRRGCPVGWEPPELEAMIAAGQRISMFIGVKTDLFQLGMVLWGLAMLVDEPERELRPLGRMTDPDIPSYFHRIVDSCLSHNPKDRLSAKELLALLPPEIGLDGQNQAPKTIQTALLDTEQRTYDPDSAIGIEDIPSLGKEVGSLNAPSHISEASSYLTFADGTASSDYYESADSIVQQVEIVPVASYEDDGVGKAAHQLEVTPKTVEAVEDEMSASAYTHTRSPVSELSSSTPTLLGPSSSLHRSSSVDEVIVEARSSPKLNADPHLYSEDEAANKHITVVDDWSSHTKIVQPTEVVDYAETQGRSDSGTHQV